VVPVTGVRLRSLDRESLSAEYLLDGSIAAFHGHFPGSPIFPAVASIALAEDSVRAMEGGHLELHAVKSAKFRAPVPPGSLVTNRCERLGAVGSGAWKVRTYLADAVAAEMQLEFQEGKTP
jgi:3-hydroxymyristoyl/3-hydroxydecanoyl-(acyl carrier protein) dehydratase